MNTSDWRRRIGGGAATWLALLALAGCNDGTPSASSSGSEATVHGVVKYKGEPVTEGTIRFDPANINRKMAKLVSAPIGKDGSYTIKTLVGGNTVGFDLPALAKKDPDVVYATFQYEVPSGDSTYNIDLPPAKP